jgi:hypothetical protein
MAAILPAGIRPRTQIDCAAVDRRNLKLMLLAALAVSALAATGCGGGSDEGSTSTASLTQCDINGKQQNLGASYVTSISVATVSCGQAEKVVTAYHQCRQANGGAGGTCDTAVQGFSCTEGNRQSVPGVQYNATVDCKKADAEIQSTYTQNF